MLQMFLLEKSQWTVYWKRRSVPLLPSLSVRFPHSNSPPVKIPLPDPDDEEATTLTLAHWTYAGHGHPPGESWLAANIAKEIRLNRETAREALADLETEGEW